MLYAQGALTILDTSVFKVTLPGFSMSLNEQMSLCLLYPAELNFSYLFWHFKYPSLTSNLCCASLSLLALSEATPTPAIVYGKLSIDWDFLAFTTYFCNNQSQSFCLNVYFTLVVLFVSHINVLFWNFRIFISIYFDVRTFEKCPASACLFHPHIILSLLFWYFYAEPIYSKSFWSNNQT